LFFASVTIFAGETLTQLLSGPLPAEAVDRAAKAFSIAYEICGDDNGYLEVEHEMLVLIPQINAVLASPIMVAYEKFSYSDLFLLKNAYMHVLKHEGYRNRLLFLGILMDRPVKLVLDEKDARDIAEFVTWPGDFRAMVFQNAAESLLASTLLEQITHLRLPPRSIAIERMLGDKSGHKTTTTMFPDWKKWFQKNTEFTIEAAAFEAIKNPDTPFAEYCFAQQQLLLNKNPKDKYIALLEKIKDDPRYSEIKRRGIPEDIEDFMSIGKKTSEESEE